MKKIIFSFMWASMLMLSFLKPELSYCKSSFELQGKMADSLLQTSNFISLAEAVKILGQEAHLKDSLHKRTGDYLRYQFTYKANTKDSLTGEFGSLFFGLEEFKQPSDAVRAYELIKKENEKNATVKNLQQTGEEAFLVKDEMNNPFIMVRKGNRTFKFRMLHVKQQSSLNELQAVVKKIVSAW